MGYDLESSLTQDFLDPYLAALTFGGKSSPEAPGKAGPDTTMADCERGRGEGMVKAKEIGGRGKIH
jgi:hypothetical protein